MIDARKQVRDKLIPLELRSPMRHDRAMDQLRDRSIIICPDANVLRRMMQIKKLDDNVPFSHLKNFEYCLSNMDEWLLQIKACKKLLDMEEIGWVIPEQIVREIDNYPAKLVELESCRNNLENTKESLHPELQKIAFKMVKKIDKLIKDATKIRTRIVDNLAVLEEELRHVESAWQLVHKDAFPNNQKHKSYKNQQMKDSVILCHLLDFHINIEKPLFFWTFDAFGYMPNEKSPSPFSNEMSPGYNIPIAYDINDILYDVEHEIKAGRKSKSVLGI